MPKTISVVSIGAGNMAHHIIPALYEISCSVVQVYSRTMQHARLLSDKVAASPVDDVDKLANNADLYLVMVPDDDIEDVINALPPLASHSVVAHTAGARSTRILASASVHYGSFYPLQSFKKNVPTDIARTPFLVDGSNEKALRMLRSLARKLSPKVYVCTDEDRLQYHLAAVFVNNFINHLACISGDILDKKNLHPEVLDAITKSTFEKIINENPCDIQTGPAIRNDAKLEKQHLKLIEDQPEWMDIYRSISKSIKARYHENNG